MSRITTHVLDLQSGLPAAGVSVRLEHLADSKTTTIATGATDDDGRLKSWAATVEPGVYRLTFETEPYFAARKVPTFFPYVQIVFTVEPGREHYHVPLLISPYGYSTYRGS